MKNTLRKIGLALAALFVFTLAACDNSMMGSPNSVLGKPSLKGDISITDKYGAPFLLYPPMAGDTLAVNVEELDPSGGFRYQWQESGEEDGSYLNITGATNAEYIIASGKQSLWIRVIITHPDYSGLAISDPVHVHPGLGEVYIPHIIVAKDIVTADISGLTVSGTFHYQWQVSDTSLQEDFEDIANAIGKTYTVPNDFGGKWLQVVVTCVGVKGNAISNAVRVRANAPQAASVVIYEGDVEVMKGTFMIFTAYADGYDFEPGDHDDIDWKLSGSSNPNTYIYGGYLVVASNEAANKLTVRASSGFDSKVYDEVTVTIIEYSTTSITITGLTSIDGQVNVSILSALDFDSIEASGFGVIDEEEVTVELLIPNSGNIWNGTGNYYVMLEDYGNLGDVYLYTNGQEIDLDDLSTIAEFAIQKGSNVIDFLKFRLVPEIPEERCTITITGITGLADMSGQVEVSIWSNLTSGSSSVASGSGAIDKGAVTVELWTLSDDPWKDTGSFYITLAQDPDVYLYTNGEAIVTGNLNDNAKYNIQSVNETIPFSKFQLIPPPVTEKEGYTVTITGLDSHEGAYVEIEVYSKTLETSIYPMLAIGGEQVEGGEVTITLMDSNSKGWRGEEDGAYAIRLIADYGNLGETYYAYTGGASLLFDFTGSDDETWGDFIGIAPTFSFTGAESFDFDLDDDFEIATLDEDFSG